jgi:hypothetical protein
MKIGKIGKGISLLGMLVIGALCGILITYQIGEKVVEEITGVPGSRSWKALGDAPLSGDESGFMYFMHWKHTATPGTTYATNLSNSSADCYEYLDILNTAMIGDTPYDTAFNGVMKLRVNDTVAYNTTSGQWEDSWVRGIATCATLGVSNQQMNIIQIANNSNFAWYHAYLQDSDGGAGSGFTISHNVTCNWTLLKGEGFY